jgi:NAD(P)H-hydrate epimerase
MTLVPSIPAITGPQMAEIDRLMMDEFGVEPIQLMEIAGHAVAVFARQRYWQGDARNRRIAILCGNGGNGGDGMVAARYLKSWGAHPEIWLGRLPHPDRGLAARQLATARRFDIMVHEPTAHPDLAEADLVIDALLGFSLSGPPSGETAALIEAANTQSAPILAVDLPSGLDATSGTIYVPCIGAETTLTLALPKTGLYAPDARELVGELTVADIGIPAAAFARLGIDVGAIFGSEEFLPVSW